MLAPSSIHDLWLFFPAPVLWPSRTLPLPPSLSLSIFLWRYSLGVRPLETTLLTQGHFIQSRLLLCGCGSSASAAAALFMAATTQAFGIYHLSPSAFLQLTYLTWHELLSFEERQYGKKPHLPPPFIWEAPNPRSTASSFNS